MWERGARVSLQSVAGRSGAAVGGDRWAGAAAAAAGCGLAGAADLIASAQRALATMISVLDLFVPKKTLLLLLLDAGKQWSFCGVPRWGRMGCAGHWAALRACMCCVEGACVRSVRVREQQLRMCSAWACGLCAQGCVCTAVLWSCVFVAWVVLGRGSVMGMHNMRSQFARVGAGQRSARRRAQRHMGPCCCQKVVFSPDAPYSP